MTVAEFNNVSFHQLAQTYRKPNKTWFLGTLFIFALWIIVGSFFTLLFIPMDVFLDPEVNDVFELFTLIEAPLLLAALLASFIPLFFGTMWAYKLFLKEPVRNLFALNRQWSWGRMWTGVYLWGGLMVLSILPFLFVSPDSVKFIFNLSSFIPFAIVALLLFPIQTTAEEFLFRGWLTRWFGQYFKNPAVLSGLGGILFTLPHMSNPEAILNPFSAGFSYFLIGFTLTWVTVRDKGLELAVGAHLINNLLAGLVFPYENSVLPTEGIWLLSGETFMIQNMGTVLAAFLFIWLTRNPDKVMLETFTEPPSQLKHYDFVEVRTIFDDYSAGKISEEEFTQRKREALKDYL